MAKEVKTNGTAIIFLLLPFLQIDLLTGIQIFLVNISRQPTVNLSLGTIRLSILCILI